MNVYNRSCERSYKNKNMLGTILSDIEHLITFKIKCERL
jgi:hypothetical protein